MDEHYSPCDRRIVDTLGSTRGRSSLPAPWLPIKLRGLSVPFKTEKTRKQLFHLYSGVFDGWLGARIGEGVDAKSKGSHVSGSALTLRRIAYHCHLTLVKVVNSVLFVFSCVKE